ncbi:DUF551 domain-containing protein [Serratia ureilytica]|uniref:DUF551 domain-containing protein n=1 Tax=Serratia ureilytica TaxID=300181 RepID=UPI003FA75683
MDNKLSELSKPVAWTDAEELRDLEKDGCGAMLSLEKCKGGDPRRQVLLFTHPAPETELKAVVERLNASGYEYEGGPVTTRNASAVVEIVLQQLDDAVKERDAQPAPAAPEEAKLGEMPFLGKNERGYVRGWNDCRAAMLAQPVSQRYKLNYPEIPDGWIACSERMPASGGDKQTYVLAGDFKNHYWPNLPNTQVGVYGDWFNDGNPTWDDGDGNDLHLREVTHWMPLPAAPEGGNG